MHQLGPHKWLTNHYRWPQLTIIFLEKNKEYGALTFYDRQKIHVLSMRRMSVVPCGVWREASVGSTLPTFVKLVLVSLVLLSFLFSPGEFVPMNF